MRFFLLTILMAFFLASAYAVKTQQKAVLIGYPEDTPQSEVDKGIEAIKNAGGIITHEFQLFKGFAAKASESALEAVKAAGEKYMPIIEDDGMVSIDGSLADSRKLL